MFSYSPLNQENREIRLVRFVHPVGGTHRDGDLPVDISLEIKHASLNDDISYAALSYTWGKATHTTQIEVNSDRFYVTKNLFAALQHLRQYGITSWIWIDALCIEQSNNREKSWQVSEMREIFGRAQIVYMWLGRGCTESDIAMDFVLRMGPRARECLDFGPWDNGIIKEELCSHLKQVDSNQDIKTSSRELSKAASVIFYLLNEENLLFKSCLAFGICDVLQRVYWTRIWTIQEVALPVEAVVIVGSRCVPLDIFDAVFTLIWDCKRWGYMRLHPRWEHFAFGLSGTLWTPKSLDIRRQYSSKKRFHLADMLWELGIAPQRPHYAATDPRDIVFGLLGILPEEDRLGLCTDYGLSTFEVFTSLTRALIVDRDGGDMSFNLDCCYSGIVSSNLPTWVPDWQQIGMYGVRTYTINHRGIFNTTADWFQPKSDMCDGTICDRALYCYGCQVDIITEVMQPPEWIKISPYDASVINDADSWVSSIIDFAGLGLVSGSGEDYVWRTIMFHDFDRYSRSSSKILALIRRMMRMENIEAGSLTDEETSFIREGPLYLGFDADSTPLSDQNVALFARELRNNYGSMDRNRTLFKTAKGMFGIGYSTIKVGDIVTLIWGVPSPIILQARDEGGYYLRGDSYVDGIMQGEYLKTNPTEEKFCIY